MATNLQTVIDKQLPEFIREDYDTFVQFLKGYYQYLDIVDKRDLEDLRDIDKTIYDYITYINGELGFATSPDAGATNIDPRLFLRKSKQSFISKGTEESYKFLFKILYNLDAQITYPWDSVLKTSDGKWQQDTSIFILFDSTQMLPSDADKLANSLVANSVVINGQFTAITVYVLKVKYIRDYVYEISLDKNFYGDINPGDTISYNNVVITVLQTTIGYNIEQGGTGFAIGDLIIGNAISNSIVIPQLLKVVKVDKNGAIQKLSTLSFGAGYSGEFFLLASKQNIVTASGSNISLSVSGTTVLSSPDTTAITKYTDYGYIINPSYFPIADTTPTLTGTISVALNSTIVTGVGTLFNNGTIPTTEQVNIGDILQTTTGTVIGTVASIQSTTQLTLVSASTVAYTAIAFRIPVSNYADPGYVGDIRGSFYQDTNNTGSTTSTGNDFALIRFSTGAVAKYQGYYIANDGFVSDSIKIQDSKYYQKYSYLITVNEKLENYRSFVNSYVHPAGIAGYSEYQIQEQYETPGLGATQSLDTYVSKATFRTINKAIINEFLSMLGNGGSFRTPWRRYFKTAHICRGVTTMACQQTGPAEVTLFYRGHFYVGGEGAKLITGLFRKCAIAIKASADPRGSVWAKLIFSAVMNPLPVLTGRGYDVLKDDRKVWKLVRQALEEGREVARFLGIRLAFDPLELIERVRDGDLEGISHRGTIFQDISAKRPTELDFITGAEIHG